MNFKQAKKYNPKTKKKLPNSLILYIVINYDNEMDSLSAYLSGGIGKTFRLHDDFKVYGVWQAGINQSKKHYTGENIRVSIYL